MIELLCPGNVATGGTESIHRLCAEISKTTPARIIYTGDARPPKSFAEYGCDYATEMPYECDALIIPEIWADREFKCNTKVINWAGADTYGWHGGRFEFGDCVHIAHSRYIVDFLEKMGLDRIYKITDVPNDLFYEQYPEEERGDVILYNPARSNAFTYKILKESGHEFRGIQNMTREEIADAMRHSKLYIDFGPFPGRDRLPREAILCGCCIITSKSGAAYYREDVTISDKYKFELKDINVPGIMHTISGILSNFKEHQLAMNEYLQVIRADKDGYAAQVRNFLRGIQ